MEVVVTGVTRRMTKKLLSAPAGEGERIAERRARAWKIRTEQGASIYTIAELLDVSPSTIAKDLQVKLTEFRELEGDEAQAWRDDMIAKLDHIITTQMQLMNTKPNIRSADNANAARMAMERKAKLLGIDAPEGINAAVNSIAELIYTVHAAKE